jgi:putative tryptophan/tyrosine transport system substrate-binding protein
MNRRAFITLAGGAAAWPLAARAQQAERVRRIGVLSGLTPDDPQSQAELAALRDGLARSGWIVGRNLQSENRFAAGDERRIRAFAEELVGNIPDVILARGTLATEILKQQTSTIPIVFVPVSDPVASGFVASFARPGSNITGFTDEEYSFGAKWLSILKNISPNLRHVMVLYDPGNANWDGYFRTLQAAEQSMMVSVSPAPVISSGDISSQMESFALQPGGGVIVVPSGLTIVNREMIIALAATHHLLAMYPFKFFAASGGLAAYGPDLPDLWRRAAEYVDRILRGAKPGDLPVQAPTRFEFVLNLNTAKALGLTIPETLLATADEVIQ